MNNAQFFKFGFQADIKSDSTIPTWNDIKSHSLKNDFLSTPQLKPDTTFNIQRLCNFNFLIIYMNFT